MYINVELEFNFLNLISMLAIKSNNKRALIKLLYLGLRLTFNHLRGGDEIMGIMMFSWWKIWEVMFS